MKIIDELYGRTELAYAIVNENVKEALRLLELCDDINQADKRGYTYLHFAAQMELPEVVNALIQKGAAIDPRTVSGGTPLRAAVVRCKAYPLERSIKVINSFLAHGADPNDCVHGITIKQLADETQIPEIIALLSRDV